MRRPGPGLLLALVLYAVLAATTVREVGVVGETAIAWALGRAPRVLVQVDPPLWAGGEDAPSAGDRAGPLVASQVRPVEVLRLGGLRLPLAVNTYTSGLPDWPARAAWLATRSPRAVVALHVVLGALVVLAAWRFLLFHGTPAAATAAALVLAARWDFVFFRKVLGGTEIALQLAAVALLWALWARRWSAGRRTALVVGIAVGLGLSAKLAFAPTLVAVALALLLTRRDRPTLGPPPPQRWWPAALAALLLLLPLAVADLHHLLAVPADPHVRSHDFPGVQLRRIAAALGGARLPVREGAANLRAWALDPLEWLARAWGARPAAGWTPLGALGWVVLAAGAALAWRDRHPTPHRALLRYLSLLLPAQVGLLLVVGREFHHLAQATPFLAMAAGLAAEVLAGRVAPRGPRRTAVALLLVLPWVADGAWQLAHTDAAVRTVEVPTFTRSGQRALAGMLRRNGVGKVVLCDYESTGVIEIAAPWTEPVHGWGAASRRRGGVLPGLLRMAAGGHFLVVRASAPMVYNLAPSPVDVEEAARAAGLRAREVDRLPGGAAVLYRVEER